MEERNLDQDGAGVLRMLRRHVKEGSPVPLEDEVKIRLGPERVCRRFKDIWHGGEGRFCAMPLCFFVCPHECSANGEPRMYLHCLAHGCIQLSDTVEDTPEMQSEFFRVGGART